MRLAALVLVAACTTFEPIERGVCGNGLLEPGEDCDSPDPSCVACAVTCTKASDCPNAAYTCGVDGLCHAPSGVFAQPTAPVLDLVDQMEIADVDRDGIGDVIGVSSTSIDVHYGDPTAALASSVTIATPQQTGTVAFGDIDGDGVPDATIITEDGIVAFTSPYSALSAAVSFFPLVDGSGQSLDVLATFPIDDLAFGIVVGGSDDAGVLIEQLGGTAATVAIDPYCAIPTSDVTPDGLDSYTIVESDKSIDQLVTVYSKGSGGTSSRAMCVTSIHLGPHTGTGLQPTGPRTVAFYNLTPAATPPPKKPVFAELESGACPSLVQTNGSGALSDFVGSMAAGYCTIAGSASALPALPTGADEAVTVGHVPLVPAVALVANDMVVLGTGLYAYSLGTFTQVYKSERTLTSVATGDLNGDSRTDAVLVAGGEADLEVLFRADNGLVPGYVVAPFQTAGVVTSIALGDFDGNGTSDIAYTEQLLDHVQLSVGFGEPGNNFTPVVEGAFSATTSMIPIGIPDSNDPASVISDLLVVEQLANGEPALTLLHGNPERTMLSYFEPRTTNDPSRQTPMRQVVTGFFGGGSTQFLDIVAMLPGLASVVTMGAAPPPPPAIAYRLDGTPAGLDPGDPIDIVFGEQVSDISDCTVGNSSSGQPPCIRNATTFAWQTGSAHDVIIGVDHQVPPQAFRVDPWSFAPDGSASGSSSASTLAAPTAQVGMTAAVAHTAFAFDVDGDGSPELVLAFAPAETADASGPGLVEACAMDSTGTPTTCSDLGALVAAAAPDIESLSCVDAGAGYFAAGGPDITPPSPGLIVLCHDGSGASLLARVTAGTATVIATGLPELRQIVVGDVTGDGVDDIVAIRGDSGDRAFTVLVQCSSRDLACQAGAVSP